MTRLLVVGDALLDRDVDGVVRRLSPDAPVPVVDDPVVRSRPGGAALAAVLAAVDGDEVGLLTALAADPPGAELRSILESRGVAVFDLGLHGATPEKVRFRTGGRPLLRVDHGGRGGDAVGPLGGDVERWSRSAAAVVVSDYGRGVAASPEVRRLLAECAGVMHVVWDPHPRGPEPVRRIALATPNDFEAGTLCPDVAGHGIDAAAERSRILGRRWDTAVAVTLGGAGSVLFPKDGPPVYVPAPVTGPGDTCGAGDRLATAAALALAQGAGVLKALSRGVERASAFVAAGGVGALFAERDTAAVGHRSDDAFALADEVRSRGGKLVATGGCFDLLHAGHIATLEAARALGDALVVCLNSDASVRRLKGPGRPLVTERDRARVLSALACVDAVVVFEEDTPAAILDRLRPAVFAKGGDYAHGTLPEADVVERHGGWVVVLPYLDGRSTTRLVSGIREGAPAQRTIVLEDDGTVAHPSGGRRPVS